MKGLNLSQFKKISTDAKSTTLKHPKGHMIIVAHAGLHPKMKEQLDQLPMHLAEGTPNEPIQEPQAEQVEPAADVPKESSQSEAPSPEPALTPAQSPDATPPNPDNSSKTKEVPPQLDEAEQKHYESQLAYVEAQNEQLKKRGLSPLPLPLRPQAEDTAPQKEISSVNPAPKEGVPAMAASPTQPTNQAGEPTPVAGGNTEPQSPMPASQGPAQVQPQQQGAPIQNNDPMGYSSLQKGLENAFAQQRAGEAAKASAEQSLGTEQAAAYDNADKARQLAANTYTNRFNDLDQHRKDFVDDINNFHIDPNHYLGSMDTGGKIATAVGLMLGGIGGGLGAHGGQGQNVALDMLNKQIDRDIDAQKMELGKKENLLSANMRQFGNIRDAADMTRMNILDMAANQLGKAAAESRGPLAEAAKLSNLGGINSQAAQIHQQMTQRQMMMDMMRGTGSSQDIPQRITALRMLGNKEMADDLQSKYIPGLPQATAVVPEAARNEITAKKQLDDAVSDLQGFLKNKGSTLSLNDRNVAAQKANVVQSLYREGLLKTVYKQGEQPLLDKVVNENPLSFVNTFLGTQQPKLQEIRNSNQRMLNRQLQQFGISLPTITEKPRVK